MGEALSGLHGGMRPGRPAASPNSQRAPARVRASGRPPSRAACGPGGLPRAQTRSGVFPIWSRILTVKTDPNRGRRSGFQLTSPTNRRGKHLRLDYLALFISDNKMSRKVHPRSKKHPIFSGNNSTARSNMCVPHAFSTTVGGSRQVTTTTIPPI